MMIVMTSPNGPEPGGKEQVALMEAELTIAQIEKHYAGQWVVAEITETYRDGRSRKGRVIAHSLTEDELVRTVLAWDREHPGVRTFQFYCGPLVEPGVVPIPSFFVLDSEPSKNPERTP
jgi:hypothetical protein